jgi:zinc transporter ZupT
MSLIPSIAIAAMIGVVAGTAGALLTWKFKRLLTRRPTLLSAFTAGVLIGISLLSVLPEALEELVSGCSWRTSDVILVFLCVGAALFLLENVCFVHEHLNFTTTSEEPPRAVESSMSRAAPGPISSDTIEMIECGDCDVTQLAGDVGVPPTLLDQIEAVENEEIADAAASKGKKLGTGFAMIAHVPSTPRSRAGGWWHRFTDDDDESPCECCDPEGGRGGRGGGGGRGGRGRGGMISVVGSGSENDNGGNSSGSGDTSSGSGGNSGGGDTAPIATKDDGVGGVRSLTTWSPGIIFRLAAWLVHAMIDGMVLVSTPSPQLLLPTAFAVLVCALQDALAFCVLLARGSRLSRTSQCLALTLFSIAFPAGAIIAAAVANAEEDGGDGQGGGGDGERGGEGAGGTDGDGGSGRGAGAVSHHEALLLMRVCISAVFVHMAIELAPPHTHKRLRNLAHLLAFALGIGVSATAELVERLATNER